MTERFGANQQDVLHFLYRRSGDGSATLNDVENDLWRTDPQFRSRNPRAGARAALKALVRRGLVVEDAPRRYCLTGRGREVMRRWREEAPHEP